MNRKHVGILSGLVLMLGALPAAADTMQLQCVIRDFKVDHPDMQRQGPNFNVIQNMVMPDIGPDGKPILNSGGLNSSFRVESVYTFNQWYNDVPGVNVTLPYAITLDNGQEEAGGVYTFAVEKPDYFFPIDGMGWGDTALDKYGRLRNFYFTLELHTTFTYTDPAERDDEMVFSFTGDDDVWVFINGKLAVDIGGVHAQKSASVNLDDEAEELGLEPGETYRLDFFFAERHTTESNFRIETTLTLQDSGPVAVSPLYD